MDIYEEARRAFEEQGEQARLARQSRKQLKTIIILLTICTTEMLLMLWLFGPPR